MSRAIADLPPRQYEALRLYAQLGSHAAVAMAMGIAEQTVSNYLREAYERLDAQSGIDAFKRMGWLDVPQEQLP